MRPAFLALLAALILPACATSLEQDYDEGAVTPYAKAVLAATERASPAEPANEISEEWRQAAAHLEKVAAAWKAKARGKPADPAALGFDLADRTPDEAALRRPIDAPALLAAAYEMSPDIRASREKLRATVEQFDQVAFLDAILRQYTAFTKDLDLRIGAPRQREMVERYFPFPGSMALKSRIVAEDAKAAEAGLARTVRTTLVRAGRAYYDYAYVREAIGIVRENIDLLKGMVEIAESKYGVGKAGQAMVLKSHVEIAALEDRLVTLRERESTVRAEINAILGLTADFPLGPPSTPAVRPPLKSPDLLYPQALSSRQEIAALKARIRRTEALIELAETKAYPDLSLGMSRFEEGAMTRVGGARMADPFEKDPRAKPRFWFGETASFIHEMRRRLEGMRKDLDALAARVGYEVKDAWFRWDAAWRQHRLYTDSLLPQAEQAYQILESGWQEGVADFLDALDAQRTWLKYRLEARAAVRDTNRMQLSLLDAVGAKLPAGDGGK